MIVRALFKRLWTRRRWRLAMLIAPPLMLLGMVGSVEMTSTSSFCGTCHVMKPFHATWSASPHKGVDCVQCHIPPGIGSLISAKLNGLGQLVDCELDRTSTRPTAVVADASCTREGCHDLATIRALARPVKPFMFDHAKHLDLEYAGISVRCTTCHSHVTSAKHFELNTSVCVTCHLLKPQASPPAATQAPAGSAVLPVSFTSSGAAAPAAPIKATNRCRDCHEPPTQTIEYRGLKVVHAEYLAYGAACESCHRGVTATPPPVGDERCQTCHDFGRQPEMSVTDLHKAHSNTRRHKVECANCHGEIRHGPDAQTMRLEQIDCRACHQGQHQIQQQIYEFPGATAAAHQPPEGAAVTPMFMAHVDCSGCHIQPRSPTVKPASGATVTVATAAACNACHKPGLGEQMIPLWQKNTLTLYQTVERMLPAPSTSLASPKAERLIAEARQLLALVRLDGSWGVHNPPYSQKLLEQAQAKIQEAMGPNPPIRAAVAPAPVNLDDPG
jgi:nitrate/TMAO reductase-like tetraheme cytochrome c subunit